ncbi:hypothetical protein F511_13406 [Dorcoceras hygrometricum]|uniref:Uncharacterized protein n=1 Tax=Dorcoceras hygrometricum TaxID=472368 RepID=A0A2Z7DBN8_9LAMI|nr:hypothetical protein F511_13406 [Dorcoceras hygrometricum]
MAATKRVQHSVHGVHARGEAFFMASAHRMGGGCTQPRAQRARTVSDHRAYGPSERVHVACAIGTQGPSQRVHVMRSSRCTHRPVRYAPQCECSSFAWRQIYSGLTRRIMVKHLATSSHDPLGITDSACKKQSVMVSVQYGPFNSNIPIRSATIDSIGYPCTRASCESLTTKHRILHPSGPHPIPPPDDPN